MKSRCISKVYKTIKCNLAGKAPKKMTLMGVQCCDSAKSNQIHNAECPIRHRLGHQRRDQHPNNFKFPRLLPISRASCRLGTNKDVARTSKMEIPFWRLSHFDGYNFSLHWSVKKEIVTVEGYLSVLFTLIKSFKLFTSMGGQIGEIWSKCLLK